ncbi:MAG: DNA recombination protein RmuC [Bacillota bacterium]
MKCMDIAKDAGYGTGNISRLQRFGVFEMESLAIYVLCAVSVVLCIFVFLLWRRLSKASGPAEHRIVSMEQALSAQLHRSMQDNLAQFSMQRDEINAQMARMMRMLSADMGRMSDTQQNSLKGMSMQLVEMVRLNQQKLDEMRLTLERNVKAMSDENAKRLDEMRRTVDEKLQTTLESRLNQSFELVSKRLEQVYRGLGEMQALAEGVGDLKRVLSNVKVRGTWGEIQLGALLEQMLAPSQYACNVAVRPGAAERVEYAIRLPGKDEDGTVVFLPIDAKFPQEAYLRLAEAARDGDAAAVELQVKQLESILKAQAKLIMEKYIHPPYTTDFAIMYLPTEGLYAEVVRRNGFLETLQRDYRVSVAGPSTLTALLNSLQMGFRTLAIEKRSSEVWQLLGECKKEFGEFAVILDKTRKKLQEAVNTMESAQQKTRRIDRKLRAVEIEETCALEDDIEGDMLA